MVPLEWRLRAVNKRLSPKRRHSMYLSLNIICVLYDSASLRGQGKHFGESLDRSRSE